LHEDITGEEVRRTIMFRFLQRRPDEAVGDWVHGLLPGQYDHNDARSKRR